MYCHTYIPDPSMSPEERDARYQVHRLRSFYRHVYVFVVVSIGLMTINALTPSPRLWFHWPMLGWGIWLTLHGIATFSRGRWFGRDWEERKVRELMTNKR